MALSVGTVSGKACQGVNVPEQTQVQASPLTLNGLGLRQATMLKVNVYVAALYVAQQSTDANAILASNTPKQLVLHFVRDVDGADLKQAWEKGFAHNAKAQLPALKEHIEQLKGWMVMFTDKGPVRRRLMESKTCKEDGVGSYCLLAGPSDCLAAPRYCPDSQTVPNRMRSWCCQRRYASWRSTLRWSTRVCRSGKYGLPLAPIACALRTRGVARNM